MKDLRGQAILINSLWHIKNDMMAEDGQVCVRIFIMFDWWKIKERLYFCIMRASKVWEIFISADCCEPVSALVVVDPREQCRYWEQVWVGNCGPRCFGFTRGEVNAGGAHGRCFDAGCTEVAQSAGVLMRIVLTSTHIAELNMEGLVPSLIHPQGLLGRNQSQVMSMVAGVWRRWKQMRPTGLRWHHSPEGSEDHWDSRP